MEEGIKVDTPKNDNNVQGFFGTFRHFKNYGKYNTIFIKSFYLSITYTYFTYINHKLPSIITK